MSSAVKKVLLIEDNKKIMRGNKQMFEWEGYEVACAMTLEEGRIALGKKRPDVIVLDVMLPDGNGIDFMRELREGVNSNIPILLLTGLTAQEDVIRGLAEGGDDYLTKPYDFPVLLARVEALMRRAERIPETLANDRLTLNITAGIATLDGIDLLLTKKEFALLMIFMQKQERYINAEVLYEKVWKAPMTNDNQALKSAIARLRDKIENCGWRIAWSRGEGYIFERE